MYTNDCVEDLENIGFLVPSYKHASYGSLIVGVFSLLLFNFFCWGLSVLLVLSVAIFAHAIRCINMFEDSMPDPEVELRIESMEVLYVADSSNKRIQSMLSKAYTKGEKSQKIVEPVIKHSVKQRREVIRNQLSRIGDIYSHIGVWKMAAVAAISILSELAYGCDSNEIVRVAVQACREAQDLLEFVDFPGNIRVKNPMNLFNSGNSRAYQMSLEADIKIQKIERLVEINWHPRVELAFEDVAEVVREFAENGRSSLHPHINFCQYWSGKRPLDALRYQEGTADLKAFSMQCVCEAILRESHSNHRELVDMTVNCLGDIIASCVLQLPKVLPQYCSKWAEEFKEENFIKALEIQAKFRPIEEMLTSADTAPRMKPEENKLPDDIKVDVQEV